MNLFDHSNINIHALKNRAYNMRWAEVPTGVIPLTSADSDFPIAKEITQSIQHFVADGYLSYGPTSAYPRFKSAIVEQFFRKGLYISGENVLSTNSAAHALEIVSNTILTKGDEAIIMEPVDFLFRYNIERAGANVAAYQMSINPKDEPDFDALEQLINSKTKAIYLCNPHNPIGKVYTEKELRKIGEIAIKHDLIIVSDEIWSDIVFAPNSFTSIAAIHPDIQERTFIISGFSKSYGLAGLRSGVLIAPNNRWFNKVMDCSNHQSTVQGSNILAQIAAIAAIESASQWLTSYINHLEKMKNLTVKKLNEIPGVFAYEPQGCFVAFANITGTGIASEKLTNRLKEQGKVAVVPGLGKWFGEPAEGHIRVSFSTSEKILTVGLNRIKKTIESL